MDKFILKLKEILDIENSLSFLTDSEKMYDFFRISKEDFLETYSYLTEEEYQATVDKLEKLYKLFFEDYNAINHLILQYLKKNNDPDIH